MGDSGGAGPESYYYHYGHGSGNYYQDLYDKRSPQLRRTHSHGNYHSSKSRRHKSTWDSVLLSFLKKTVAVSLGVVIAATALNGGRSVIISNAKTVYSLSLNDGLSVDGNMTDISISGNFSLSSNESIPADAVANGREEQTIMYALKHMAASANMQDARPAELLHNTAMAIKRRHDVLFAVASRCHFLIQNALRSMWHSTSHRIQTFLHSEPTKPRVPKKPKPLPLPRLNNIPVSERAEDEEPPGDLGQYHRWLARGSDAALVVDRVNFVPLIAMNQSLTSMSQREYCFGDCAVVGNAKLNLPRTSSMPALERREEAAEAKDMLTSASQQASEDDGAIGMPGDLNATAGGET